MKKGPSSLRFDAAAPPPLPSKVRDAPEGVSQGRCRRRRLCPFGGLVSSGAAAAPEHIVERGPEEGLHFVANHKDSLSSLHAASINSMSGEK